MLNGFHSSGVDDLLSKHVSHLFIRDPLVIFSETIDQDDTTSSDHFEVIVNKSALLTFILFRLRTFNLRTGKPSASNLLPRIHQLAGELNLEAWRSK